MKRGHSAQRRLPWRFSKRLQRSTILMEKVQGNALLFPACNVECEQRAMMQIKSNRMVRGFIINAVYSYDRVAHGRMVKKLQRSAVGRFRKPASPPPAT